ncbi:MAG: cytochrome BD ubiquinol oxidase subunit II [Candidatus Chloroheliales bacterium]|nr:MAG: cytochrome BD ubiquinol oxidase subunit II [Chloroflexota bacterium]
MSQWRGRRAAALPPLNYIAAGVIVISLTLYAVLGGADFGGGVWDALASGPRAKEQRRAVAEAMGPVWEANHVWLIIVIVLLFVCFAPAFAALFTALNVPLSIALVGIMLRGSAFVFRAHGAKVTGEVSLWGVVFSAASIITPVLLGSCFGAIVSGNIRVDPKTGAVNDYLAWFAPYPLLLGLLALAICAYLAAVYLTLETKGELQEDFRKRAIGAWLASVILATIALPLSASAAPRIWGGLTSGFGLALVPAAVIIGAVAVIAVWQRRYGFARIAGVAQVALIIGGWALAQSPYLLYPDITIDNSASANSIILAMLISLAIGAVVLLPSMWLLYSMFKGHNPAAAPASEE